jgi:alpha-L-fucosidase
MKVNGESIYGTSASQSISQPSWGRITHKGDDFYLHVFNWPANGQLTVSGIGQIDASPMARLLADKDRKALKLTRDAKTGSFTISLPPQPSDPIDTVVVLSL